MTKILGRRVCQTLECAERGPNETFDTFVGGRLVSRQVIPLCLKDVVAETEHAYLLSCGHELLKTNLPPMWRSEEMFPVEQEEQAR